MQRVTIVGLGLIGGSLGLALRQVKAKDAEIVGYDHDHGTAGKAHRAGAVDRTERDLHKAVQGAGIVIIATPVLAIREVMREIAPSLQAGTVVTDTGSAKAPVLKWAEESLPGEVSFVGGHPMAGREASGPLAADANLFRGCVYCVIPGRGASANAVKLVSQLASAIGATPFFLHADEHDSFVAAISHLPMLMSVALMSSASSSPSWQEMSRVAAGGFRDCTRLASSEPQMQHDIYVTNRAYIAEWLERLVAELTALLDLSEEGGEPLLKRLTEVREAREKWVHQMGAAPGRPTMADVPTASEQMTSLFVGEHITRRSREIMQRLEERAKRPPEDQKR